MGMDREQVASSSARAVEGDGEGWRGGRKGEGSSQYLQTEAVSACSSPSATLTPDARGSDPQASTRRNS